MKSHKKKEPLAQAHDDFMALSDMALGSRMKAKYAPKLDPHPSPPPARPVDGENAAAVEHDALSDDEKRLLMEHYGHLD